MAISITIEEWERWRNAIHTFYILDNLPLLGPSGVIETMKLRYNFHASKRQYEYRLQQWGFEKNMPGWYYPIVATKLGKRKLAGEESNVYWRDELVPAAKIRKESSRHGYMTTLERVYKAQENANAGQSPKTPPGVQICTAPPYFSYRKVLQDLPILQLLRSMNFNFNSPLPFESSVSTLSPILCGRIINAASALIPISAFNQELPGSSITVDNIQQNTSIQILKAVAYATSNNFPTNCNRTEIYKLFKGLGTISPKVFQLLQASSNQALLQGLFRLSIEEEDVFLASTLLNAGADPNENVCMHEECPIPLRPLQYSCLVGNFELVKELLRVTALIDRSECGWSCSPVLFAINGCFKGLWESPLTEEAAGQSVGTSTTDSTDSGNDDNDDNDDVVTASTPNDGGGETQVRALIMLIRELLNAGADINAIAADLDDAEYSLKEWRDEAELDWSMHPLIYEKHSALTLGSSFRCPELVDFLISNGADVGFHIKGNRSALRECLCNLSEYHLIWENISLLLEDRLEDPDHPGDLPGVVETAKSLIMAQVDVNDHEPCDLGAECDEHDYLECYSAFDLGMLTQDEDLIDALWTAGAKPTSHSLDIAIKAGDFDLFRQLLDSEALFPEWAITSKEWEDTEFRRTESRNATEVQKRRAMILVAIRLGECGSLERLIQSHDCSNIVKDCTALQEAIGVCCQRGYHDTLVCLLQSNILPRVSAGTIFGSSIALALSRGDLGMVDVLLAAGADVNKPIQDEDDRRTALEIGIKNKTTKYVQKLLDHGANIESPTEGNLLVKAIDCGDHDMTQLLMAYATPDGVGTCRYWFAHAESCGWYCPLAAAICNKQWPLVDQLLQYGPSLNPKCRSSRVRKPCMTPLWASVYRKNMAITQLLLQRGAEVNDELALIAASEDKDSMFLRLLVEKLSADKNSEKSNTLHVALHMAMSHGHLNNFHLILHSGMVDVHALSNGKTLLHFAIHFATVHGHQFLRRLLEAGVSPDSITHDDQLGPLTALLVAIDKGDSQCVRIILETQARTNREWPPEMACSPLQLASFKGDLEKVRILLCHGQDPDIVSSCTWPYKWYSNSLKTHHRIGTCVQNATMEKDCEILKLLLRHGANPNLTTTHCPHTALQIACRDGSLELVELLLEYGAKVNLAPAKEFGATALQFAAIGGFLGIAHLLLEKGAEVNAAPAEVKGRTALEGAAEHGRIDMVQLLVNAGADISELGQGQYERALHRASMNGHTATGRLLRSFLS
ncbi:ankyrin repeat-containing protein [Pochonia chlamydosporia 170]|uniref:Ankyrin repeat-containing protein n=1 Tax=Pochonia chlamydosporia 170 TaxID=1380566 RepID=A0A179FLC5_METCM|nr:ankyrin repeat-containing protein [Pochonia chlamydosporia 170]OAQ66020.1 ankyrin repeat-containing protein [Pochonia chlamydosporia 170]